MWLWKSCSPTSRRAALGLGNALQLQAELGILDDREPRQQRVLLEDDAAVGARSLDPAAAEGQLALGRRHEARHQAEQRGLAAAGGAEGDDEVALFDGKVHVLQGDHRPMGVDRRIGQADVADFERLHPRLRQLVSWVAGPAFTTGA
jgi:hypothetical protein